MPKTYLLTFFIFLYTHLGAAGQKNQFRTNLQGYLVNAPKTALLCLMDDTEPDVFLLNTLTNSRIQTETSLIEKENWHPFKKYIKIDFSHVDAVGSYQLVTSDGKVNSNAFKIGNFPNWQEDVLGFMRSQRCGYNPYLDVYCHQKDGLSFYAEIPDSTEINATGGWHDAGDQLKYLITGSNATARMLQAWFYQPDSFKDDFDHLGKPSPNGLPDILDEAKWGLDWIMNLHPSATQLYHQVADDRDHRGFKLPHKDNADYGWGENSFRPVYQATGEPQGLGKYKSKATGMSNVAGRSAAALALGFQAFSTFPVYQEYAQKCLIAARELYVLGQRKEGYQQGNSYGAPYRYEENTWADDMEWAAAELAKSTGKKRFLKEARKYAKIINTWSWMERDTASHYEMYPFVNMGHYALWEAGNKKDKKTAITFYKHNLQRIKERAERNPYGAGHLFIWCSNNLAAAVASQSILYKKMTGSSEFEALAINHINWLFGLNPWASSMITGIPENTDYPQDVHMPFWKILNKEVKGSLADGPLWSTIHENMLAIVLSEEDEYKELQPKHIKYHDDFADYSTNEPTMDGSADIILLLTYLNSN